MRDARGFTLVEVLVAAAIGLAALVAVASMSLLAYERMARSERTISAATAAHRQVEWLRTRGYDDPELNAGSSTTNLDGIYQGFSVTTEIADDTPTSGIKHVVVTAHEPAGRSVRLDTLIGRGPG